MEHILECIKTSTPVYFSKYGDGEYLCMTTSNGTNCDGDMYSPELGNALKKALSYMSQKENSFIAKWHTGNVTDYLQELVPERTIPWNHYHTLMSYPENFGTSHLRDFVQVIKNTSDNVIIVSNKKNIEMKTFFNGNKFVVVPERSWFNDYYADVYNEVCKNIDTYCHTIILTSAGLASKVLISDIATNYSNVSCLDLGSSFDYICTGKNTRGQRWDVSIEKEYYSKLNEYYK